MTEQTCPDCGRPRARNSFFNEAPSGARCFADYSGTAQSTRECRNVALTRLRSRISSLEEALLVADRMRFADDLRASMRLGLSLDFRERVAAYDAARERTRT